MVTPSPENAALVFLDLQAAILMNSRTVPAQKVERAASVLARLSVLHRLPAAISAVGPGGAYLESVTQPLGLEPRLRTQTSAFADAGLVAALKATGRQVLVLSGVASEIVVQRTALDAIDAGFSVFVAVDACGGLDPRTEDAAWRRIVAAGGTTTSAVALAAELAGDFMTPTGGATLALMYELLGA